MGPQENEETRSRKTRAREAQRDEWLVQDVHKESQGGECRYPQRICFVSFLYGKPLLGRGDGGDVVVF